MTDITKIQQEVNTQLGNKETLNALVATTFKGLEPLAMKRAIMEGMMRGFKFEDFLEKNVYAIPFKGGYSLVTSVDYARKIGMRNGIVGKEAPVYEENDKGIISCTVTVKRKVGDYIGEYSAKVYFNEYYRAGKGGYPSLWDSKPRTMIAKVAEMHALRMACPEELSQSYLEEEVHSEIETKEIDITGYEKKLNTVTSIEELKATWASLPIEAKKGLENVKEELKKKYEDTNVSK